MTQSQYLESVSLFNVSLTATWSHFLALALLQRRRYALSKRQIIILQSSYLREQAARENLTSSRQIESYGTAPQLFDAGFNTAPGAPAHELRQIQMKQARLAYWDKVERLSNSMEGKTKFEIELEFRRKQVSRREREHAREQRDAWALAEFREDEVRAKFEYQQRLEKDARRTELEEQGCEAQSTEMQAQFHPEDLDKKPHAQDAFKYPEELAELYSPLSRSSPRIGRRRANARSQADPLPLPTSVTTAATCPSSSMAPPIQLTPRNGRRRADAQSLASRPSVLEFGVANAAAPSIIV